MSILATLLIQDLQTAVENSSKQPAYSFSFDRSGGRQRGRGPADVEGVFAGRAVYLKAGKIELIRTSEATLVRLDGGDWMAYAQAVSELKKTEPKEADKGRNADPEVSLEDLSKIPAPHQLMTRLVAQMRKPASTDENGSTIVKGDLSESYSRDLVKTEWFRLGDERDWSEASGSLAVSFKDKLVTLLEFTLSGKLLPENPRNLPRQNPNNPRQAGRMGLQDTNVTLRIRLDEFGSAKLPLPDELLKKLNLK